MTPARFLQDWLEGWNGHDLDVIMRRDGILRGRAAIRELFGVALARFPKLRFELEELIERPYGLLVVYRKLGVFAERPGLTVEAFELANGLVTRNVVYWGAEEVASRLIAH